MFFTQGGFDDERSPMSLQSFNISRPLFGRSKVSSSSACNAWGPKHGIALEGITSFKLSEAIKWLSARSNSLNLGEMEYWTLNDHEISCEDDPWNEINASKPYVVLWYCRHDAGVYQSH